MINPSSMTRRFLCCGRALSEFTELRKSASKTEGIYTIAIRDSAEQSSDLPEYPPAPVLKAPDSSERVRELRLRRGTQDG